jgi:DNA-binding ferritin-like protein
MNKTRKSSKQSVIVSLLQFSNILKLFHWNTKSYALHVSADKFYESLTDKIDSLVEILLGKTRLNCFSSSIQIGICSDKIFMSKLETFTKLIETLKKDHLLTNICDDILDIIHHFDYFASFNK